MRSAGPTWTPTMFPSTAEASAVRAGTPIVSYVHVYAPAAPLSDLCSRWTPTMATFDITVDDVCAHASSNLERRLKARVRPSQGWPRPPSTVVQHGGQA